MAHYYLYKKFYETWKILSSNYNKQQIMSIIIVTGRYHNVAMANNSLGMQLAEKKEGFGELSEKLNQIDWIQQNQRDTKKAMMLYRSKINEIDRELEKY